ncbi:hypothetical protein [Paramicrobacterium agarici]|uniref:hypothetical protein n=1 Tax=Paramicrobacterium agarici TaxID=630514 RepID=UPI00114E426B|nr:hypothetical protein [Microbacterium agarici]TQO22915.1 hypothetical protein FB385_1758 [Microbacterium agarici]
MTKNLGANDQYRALAGDDPDLALARWETMGRREKQAWARAMVDFLPTNPGPTMLSFIIGPARAGDTSNLGAAWEHNAGAFSLLGFDASDFYTLHLCIRRRVGDLLSHAGTKYCIATHNPDNALGLIPEDWAEWLRRVRAGVSPLRALDVVLDGDTRTWPRATTTWDDGSVDVSV